MLLLAAGALASIISCSGPQGQGADEYVEPSVSVPLTELSYEEGTQFVKVTASGYWDLSFDFGGQTAWASVDQQTGSGSKSGIILTWSANPGTSQRSFILKLSASGKTVRQEVIQKAKGAAGTTPTDLKADVPGKWMELPATNDKNLYFFTHKMSLNGSKVRNWSFYYDPVAKLSAWVAYPLNKNLIGSGSRTDEWGLDPKVPEKYQQIIYKGYSGKSSDGAFFERGHQLPSADRLRNDDNITTFYFTNMTPQKGMLNGQAWASLEGRVRDWSKDMDTLYVVTGADFRNSKEVAYDNVGAEIPVPTGYYKALLGYKKSLSIGQSTKGYIGIAFYFDHKSYSGFMSQKMTIDALEEKVAQDFFVNLPGAVGESVAKKVEAEIDSWWK